MIPPLLFGAVGGLGLALLVLGFSARPETLTGAMRRLELPNWGAERRQPVGRVQGLLLRALGSPSNTMLADLAVVERPIEHHAVDKLQTALFWGGAPVGLSLVAGTAGARWSPGLVVLAAVAGLLGGWFLSDHQLRDRAENRRLEFRSTLVTYLQLVAILLAGGAGTNQALHDAALYGHGWAFAVIRRSLRESVARGRSPWVGFAATADRLGLVQLRELAASMQLAGESGAHVRRSLLAKAESLRIHELTEIESEAARSSEKMGGPVGAMVIGFVIVMGYPAVVAILEL